MTSLSLQLQKLQKAGTTPISRDVFKKPSLLFDVKEAADIPLDAIFNLGLHGVEELCTINRLFETFKDTLFNEDFLRSQRSFQTEKFNKKVHRVIAQFLYLSAPYFLLKPTIKALEWLIRRYEIEKYETETILAAFFPYHETRLFARLLQVLDMSKTGDKWSWLELSIKNGNPVPKLTVTTRCKDDLTFMRFLCNLPTDAEEALIGNVDTSELRAAIDKSVDTLRSFSVSTIVCALELIKVVTEEIMGVLMPQALQDLRTETDKCVVSAYIIICQLVQKVTLSPKMKEACFKSLCLSLNEKRMSHGILCLSVLVKYQKMTNISKSSMSALVKLSSLSSSLVTMTAEHDISAFLALFLTQLLVRAMARNDVVTMENESQEKGRIEYNLILTLMKEIDMPLHVPFVVARKMIEIFMSSKKGVVSLSKASKERMKLLAEIFERRHPSVMEHALKAYKKVTAFDVSDKEQGKWFEEFNKIVYFPSDDMEVEDAAPSLYLSLNHPSADIRMVAVRVLIEGARDGKYDKSYTSEQLLARFSDDDPSLIAELIDVGEDLVNYSNPEILLETLLDLLYKGKCTDREKLCKLFLWFVKNPVTFTNSDLHTVVFFEVLNAVLTCSDMESPLHLTRIMSVLTEMYRTSIAELWNILKQSCSEIDLTDFNGDDTTKKARVIKAVLSALGKQLVNSTKFPNMMDVAFTHAFKGPLMGSPLWVVCILASEALAVENVQQLIPLLLKQLEANKSRSCKEKFLKSFLAQKSVNTIELEVLKIVANTETNSEKRMLDVRAALFLFKKIIGCLPTMEQSSDPGDDRHYQCHVQLFRLLCLRGSEVSSRKSGLVGVFRILLKEYLTSHFTKQSNLVEFLWKILGDLPSLSWMFGTQPPVETTESCLFALHIYTSTICNIPTEEISSAMVWKHIRVFLIFMAHPSEVIREAAVSSLTALDVVCEKCNLADKGIRPILKAVIGRGEEVKQDPSRMQGILTKFFQALGKREQRGLGLGDSKKTKRRKEVLLKLLSDEPGCHFYSIVLLMRDVSSEEFSTVLLGKAHSLVMESKSRGLTPLEVNALHIVLKKLPEISQLRRNEDHDYLHIMLELIAMDESNQLNGITIQQAAIKEINSSLLNGLGSHERQMALITALLELILQSQNVEVSSKVKHALGELPLTTRHFVTLFEKTFATLEEEDRPKAAKRARRTKAAGAADSGPDPENKWQQILLVLEEIHRRPFSANSESLVQYYFKILKGCNENKESVPSVEFMKQLAMGCLLKVTTAIASGQHRGVIKPADFNVELIIGCIRNSEDYHTHQQALLVLGKAAQLFPDVVLHNMMAIFTFMGTSILRQDDSYTFEIIQETISSVVPVLIGAKDPKKCSSETSKHLVQIKTLVIGVFADAAPYIPKHRRLTLFTHLANVIGPEENLHVILTFLLTRAVLKKKPISESEISKEDVLSEEFCASLAVEFSPKIVMTAIGELIHLVTVLMNKEAVGSNDEKIAMDEDSEDESLSVFDSACHSIKELRYFVFMAVNVTSCILSNQEFKSKVQELEEGQQNDIERSYLRLLHELLAFVKEESKLVEKASNENVVKFRKAIIHKGCNIIDKIDAGLKFDTFIRVFKNLIGSESTLVQRKAVELVCEKLKNMREISEHQKEELLSFVDLLVGIIKEKDIAEQGAMGSKQMALLALKTFSGRLGAENASKFAATIPVILEFSTKAGRGSQFKAQSMLCLAEYCSAFSVGMVAHLQSFVPTIIESIQLSSIAKENLVTFNAVTAAIKIVESIPQFLSPFLSSLVHQACMTSSGGETSHKQIQEKIQELRKSVGARIPSRILLKALLQCLEDVRERSPVYLVHVMDILWECLSHVQSADVKSDLKTMHQLFLKCLEYRSLKPDLSPEEILIGEQSVVNTYCLHVMKLSENSFRPLFWKIFSWATDTPKERLITFFHLCCGVAGKLKSLFLLFAKQVIKTAQATLEENHIGKTDTLPFQDSFAGAKSSQLIAFTLECLTKCFTYDRIGFVGKDEFDFLLDTLVDQVENDVGSPELYEKRVTEYLVPCIRSFTTVLHDESCWKALNYRILLKTKSGLAKVRIASLDLLGAVQSALKENYASILPETIPFLAELMEDENEDVEKKCQDIIARIEANLGESLQKYF